MVRIIPDRGTSTIFKRRENTLMKEYMQPEVELVKFTSESVTIMQGEGSAEDMPSGGIGEIVIP